MFNGNLLAMPTSKKIKIFNNLLDLREEIIQCRLCPRLVAFRETVPPRKSFEDQVYWRKPVPGHGDPKAWMLIVGLAPPAHGGNRTGRVFTGDPSATFLMRGLYKAGFANQPFSESMDDGLRLHGCYITPAVKCAPPHHKPTREEFFTCSRYFQNELRLLKHLKCVLVLGKFAFDAYMLYAKTHGHTTSKMKFKFGGKYVFEGLPTLYASYHPSPRNTYTGKLTDTMFQNLLQKIKKEV